MHQTAHQQPTGLGARAVLELQLQDAERDLAGLIQERDRHIYRGDELHALACEPGQPCVRLNAESALSRFHAFSSIHAIAKAREQVADITARLAALEAAPIVLSAEQCAAVDDTHNYRSEVAA